MLKWRLPSTEYCRKRGQCEGGSSFGSVHFLPVRCDCLYKKTQQNFPRRCMISWWRLLKRNIDMMSEYKSLSHCSSMEMGKYRPNFLCENNRSQIRGVSTPDKHSAKKRYSTWRVYANWWHFASYSCLLYLPPCVQIRRKFPTPISSSRRKKKNGECRLFCSFSESGLKVS